MSVHKKMTRSERAKQFVPFAALKGYSEALRRAEEEALRNYEDEDTERTAPEREEEEKK